MKRVVKVQVRQAYGQTRVYPACPTGALFARLIGTKTFSPRDLGVIEELGYVIEQVPSYVDLLKEET